MSRQVEDRVRAELDEAEKDGRCCVPTSAAQRRAMRARSPEVIEPVAGLFARRSSWRGLDPATRTIWLMRGLARRHGDWAFCGASAAVAYGLPVTWELLDEVSVAAPPGAVHQATGGIVRHHIADDAVEACGGLPLVPFWRTVFDCLASFELPDALAIADAALRVGRLSARGLAGFLAEEYRGRPGVRRALGAAVLADARAESGGESIARATMFQLGFAKPELQVWIEDPVEPGKWFRVDFLWLTEDGRLVIGELDGRQKTSRPDLMGGRDALRVMQDERLRESHLTALRPAIVRFSYDDARDPARLGPLLERFGVPRGSDTWPTEAPTIVTRSSRLDYAEGRLRIVRATARA